MRLPTKLKASGGRKTGGASCLQKKWGKAEKLKGEEVPGSWFFVSCHHPQSTAVRFPGLGSVVHAASFSRSCHRRRDALHERSLSASAMGTAYPLRRKSRLAITRDECNTALMKTKITFWKEADGRFLGYLNDYPNHWTQGEDLADLKEQLRDLFQTFSTEEIPGIRKKRKSLRVGVKRRDLISTLEEAGCAILRHGGRHDIYHNPRSGKSQPVPRHREINAILARKIIKDLTRS